jgi:uncharacterized repeat protein (TIGR03803 family)
MKTRIQNLFVTLVNTVIKSKAPRLLRIAVIPKLLAVASLYLAITSTTKGDVILQPLHAFWRQDENESPLIQAKDSSLYGTFRAGGAYGFGAIFRITTNGAFTLLYCFTGGNDGAACLAGLVQANDGYLYGTTQAGGTNYYGTVFRITTNGAMTTLYSFTGGNDGANPFAGLVQARDGNLYGTTYGGGTNSDGTVFRITTNGTFTPLCSFTGGTNGAAVQAGLMQASDGYLYGTTYYGGTNGDGTVFRISTNGVLTTLYSFTGGNDGANPSAGLVQASDGNLYGTAGLGGTNNSGAIFRFTTSGVLTALYSFGGIAGDGAVPNGLVQANDGNLYGTTTDGGDFYSGTVFRITTEGTYTQVYAFTGENDGNLPFASLVQAKDGNLYAATYDGGTNYTGAAFRISTSGVFTPLYSFPGPDEGIQPEGGVVQANNGYLYGPTTSTIFGLTTNGVMTTLYSNIEANYIVNQLMQASDGYLYGTTYYGGTNGDGTVFQISTNGVLTTLYSFTGGNDGANPSAGLVQANDGNLYGTTEDGNTGGTPTLFRITTSGTLTTLASTNIIPWYAPLVQASNGNLYGANHLAGTPGADGFTDGCICGFSTSGTLILFYSFTGGNDGAYPGHLVLAGDGNIYGTTQYGGGNCDGSVYGCGYGTVFRLTTSGKLTTLYSFTGGSDGGLPQDVLVQGSDGDLYGMTSSGSTNGYGGVYKVNTNGIFTSLYSFSSFYDPNQLGYVRATLGRDGNIYGTTSAGGPDDSGTIFRIIIGSSVVSPPIIRSPLLSGSTFSLSFQTTASQNYTIQQNTNLATTNWLSYSNFIGNGSLFQLVTPVTNSKQMYFRIRQP